MTLDALPKEVLQEVFLLEQQKNKLDTREKAQENFWIMPNMYMKVLSLEAIIKSLQKNWS